MECLRTSTNWNWFAQFLAFPPLHECKERYRRIKSRRGHKKRSSPCAGCSWPLSGMSYPSLNLFKWNNTSTKLHNSQTQWLACLVHCSNNTSTKLHNSQTKCGIYILAGLNNTSTKLHNSQTLAWSFTERWWNNTSTKLHNSQTATDTVNLRYRNNTSTKLHNSQTMKTGCMIEVTE